jgi:hypothetical protein
MSLIVGLAMSLRLVTMKKKTSKSKSKAKAVPKRAKKKGAVKAKSAMSKGKKPAVKAKKLAASKPQMASRRRKKNEVGSDRSLRSSLTEDVTLAPRRDEGSLRAGQSGDLQGLSDVEDADSESVDELLEDGQAFEAEVVEGVEDVKDEKEVPSRGRYETEGEPPEDYGDKDRI